MKLVAAVMLGLISTGAVADPPDFPDPPVRHTNQGRTVDHAPKIGGEPRTGPRAGFNRNRLVVDPPDPWNDSVERLRAPDFDEFRIGSGYNANTDFNVTPAPGTLGLIALGGLILARRRRD